MKTIFSSTALPIVTLLALAWMIFSHSESINASEHLPPNPLSFLIAGSATGFYGLDNDGNLIPDRSGIMLAFNHPNIEESIFEYAIWVKVGDGRIVFVAESHIRENLLFIKLAEELASDATPIVAVSRYFRANPLDDGKFPENLSYAEAEIDDGIPPTLAMTLSGGSGTGIDDEGPDRLTKDKIDITVTSDEPLVEPPNITVVCNNIQWTESADSTLIHNNIDNFIANRAGQLTATDAESLDGTSPDYSCGSDGDLTLTTSSMTTISETSWSYEWRNKIETPYKLSDGLLTAVAHARDQSEYRRYTYGSTVHNWNSATANFTLDTILKSPLEPGQDRLIPNHGQTTYEPRPYFFIEFDDSSTVALNSVKFDGFEVNDDVEILGDNEIVYWPLSMELGEHHVVVEATDAAGNSTKFEFRFTVARFSPFILRLQAGWNAISFPSNPVDNDINTVFENLAIQIVASWNNRNPWALSVRRNGVWETVADFNTISRVYSRDGYWVYSSEETHQKVPLHPPRPRRGSSPVVPHPAEYGWLFVGVIDLDRDQIEDHFGSVVVDADGHTVTAYEYLGSNYELAYRWNAHTQSFERLYPKDPVKIGEAIWVYYPEPGGP